MRNEEEILGASARKHPRELTPQKFPKLSHSPEGKKADGRALTNYSENKLIKFGALLSFPSRTKSLLCQPSTTAICL